MHKSRGKLHNTPVWVGPQTHLNPPLGKLTQTEPGAHWLFCWQKSYGRSQYVPTKLLGHLHTKLSTRSTHVELFWHGDEAHSFTFDSQRAPLKPERHRQRKLGRFVLCHFSDFAVGALSSSKWSSISKWCSGDATKCEEIDGDEDDEWWDERRSTHWWVPLGSHGFREHS